MRKLIAVDLDGTLLRTDSTISTASVEFLQNVSEAGHFVTVATGRSWASSLPYVRQLGIRNPYIVHNGAWITDTMAKTIRLDAIASDVALDFWRYCSENKIPCTFITTGGIYINKNDHYSLGQHRRYDNMEPEVKYDNPPGSDESLLAICISNQDSDRYLAIFEQLKNTFGCRLQIYRVGNNMINVAAAGVSKGRALEHLASLYSIPMSDVIAFGDNHNDVDMLQKAGIGVAMEGADPDALAAADIIAPPNDQDGVIAVLRQLI